MRFTPHGTIYCGREYALHSTGSPLAVAPVAVSSDIIVGRGAGAVATACWSSL